MASPLIIDVHMHIFDTKEQGRWAKAQYPGWEFGKGAPLPPYSEYDGDVEDAAASLTEAGASRAVMVHFHLPLIGLQAGIDEKLGEVGGEERARAVAEADASAGEALKESNVRACLSVKDHPEILPFVSIDPWVLEPNEAADHLANLVKNHGARGIKLHAGSQHFTMDDRRMWPIYDACVQLDIPIVAHSGRDLGEIQYSDPRSYRGAYEAFPRLKLVMAHLGNGSWRQTKEVADAFPNALFDTSEITEWHGAPLAPTHEELARLIQDIGPDRVMMGTDFPWWSPAHCVQGIMDLPTLSNSEKEAILGANAARILGI
jgi:uncharacterized protein